MSPTRIKSAPIPKYSAKEARANCDILFEQLNYLLQHVISGCVDSACKDCIRMHLVDYQLMKIFKSRLY